MSATAILRGPHGLLRSRPQTRDNVIAYQDACLRNLVQSAYANVPYYRRSFDRFLLPDGRQLHGYTLGEAVEASRLGVRRFRIVQEKREGFLVELVLYENPTGQDLPRLKRRLGEILGPGVHVALRVVPSLTPMGSRKFHTFISLERLEALTRSMRSNRSIFFRTDPT